MDNEKYLYLCNIFINLSSPESFSSLEQVWRRVLKEGNKFNIKRKEVALFLSSFPAFTLQQKTLQKIKRGSLLVPHINYMWQMDLLVLNQYKEYNSNVSYLLVTIDTLSRVTHLQPMIDKRSSSCLQALEIILKKTGVKPACLQSDKGREFDSKLFTAFCKQNNIRQYFIHSEIHSGHVERVVRTFKKLIFSHFLQNDTLHYLDVLSNLEENYNRKYHRILGMSPYSVNKENEYTAFLNSYKNHFVYEYKKLIERYRVHCLKLWKKYKLSEDSSTRKSVAGQRTISLGSKVRLARLHGVFHKAYKGSNYTTEIFTVYKIIRGNPNRYLLKDENNEVIKGYVFFSELKKVSDIEKYYRDVNGENKPALIKRVYKSRENSDKVQEYLVELEYKDSGKKLKKWITSADLYNY